MEKLRDESFGFRKEHERYWRVISDPKYLTLSNRESIEILESINFEDFKSFMKDYLLPNGNERRLISLWIIGKGKEDFSKIPRDYKSYMNFY